MKSYTPYRYDLFFTENNFRSGFSQNILEYIKNNIQKTDIKKEKFKYMYIKNFFPEKDYLVLLDFLKKIKNFSNKYSDKLYDDGTNNYNISDAFLLKFKENLNEEKKLEIIDEFNDVFSLFITDICYILQYSQRILINIFYDEIIERDKSILDYGYINRKYLKYQTELFFNILERRRPDFFITPHLHTAYELIDCLFYTPENDLNSFNGTSLYSPNREVDIKADKFSGYFNLDSDDFDNYYTFKYTPNSVICWPNVPYSIHGSEYENSVKNTIEKSYIFFGTKRVFPNYDKGYIFKDDLITI